jgi:hypothetical protein
MVPNMDSGMRKMFEEVTKEQYQERQEKAQEE